jgi:hypothetical protein
MRNVILGWSYSGQNQYTIENIVTNKAKKIINIIPLQKVEVVQGLVIPCSLKARPELAVLYNKKEYPVVIKQIKDHFIQASKQQGINK